MENQFKLGDRVIVTSLDSGASDDERKEYIGKVGIIADVDDWMFPYEIRFEDELQSDEYLFGDDDLELFEKKPTIHTGSIVMTDLCDCEKDSYINIKFQKGAFADGVNGCTTEDVINLLIDRLSEFQNGELSCRENALAITKLEEARLWLNERTRKRVEQGVEGKYENHG